MLAITCKCITMAAIKRQTDSGIMEAYLRLRENGSLKKIGIVEEKKHTVDSIHTQTIDNLIKLKKTNSMQNRHRISCPGRLGDSK